MKDNKKKSFMSAFLGIFRTRKKIEEIEVDDTIITPTKAVLNNFIHNKLAMFGLIGFLSLVCCTFIGAALNPVNFNQNESELVNVAPGMGILNFPSDLNGNVKKIESGTTFNAAIDNNGKFYIWGTDIYDIKKVPKEVQQNKVHDIAVGDTFIIALLDNGDYVSWGYDFSGQLEISGSVKAKGKKIKQIFAGKGFAGAIDEKGKGYVWGAGSSGQDIIPKNWQEHIVKAAPGKFNILYLLDDGSIRISGSGYVASVIPEELTNGSVKVVDMAIGKNNAIALDENGKVYTWGNSEYGLLLSENEPINEKIVQVQASYTSFAMLGESGKIHVIGRNTYGELNAPEISGKFTKIYGNYFQFFGVDDKGDVHGWGNKGFLLGSDELGRDLLVRLFHGGKVSLFVGVVAVVISSFMGILTGLLSGFLGGWVDNLIQRLGEVITSVPFLPLVMTLSFAIGNKMTPVQKMYLVMVLIGFLSWVGLSRLIRGQILIEREKDFVLAARALGLKESTIILKHILPSILNIAIVSITLNYAGTMLTESGLSFLGFGIQPPIPSWGNMLTNSQQSAVIEVYWWRWVFPTLAILIAVLTVNLIGDGLREAMDPKSNDK